MPAGTSVTTAGPSWPRRSLSTHGASSPARRRSSETRRTSSSTCRRSSKGSRISSRGEPRKGMPGMPGMRNAGTIKAFGARTASASPRRGSARASGRAASRGTSSGARPCRWKASGTRSSTCGSMRPSGTSPSRRRSSPSGWPGSRTERPPSLEKERTTTRNSAGEKTPRGDNGGTLVRASRSRRAPRAKETPLPKLESLALMSSWCSSWVRTISLSTRLCSRAHSWARAPRPSRTSGRC
mmetsp:Transcript_7075/g.18065  ORF Transcript_7075/g.18065 Transcript_7075/m.18065 type:complete len:240 (+) Transcript_7075:844-1563(+)